MEKTVYNKIDYKALKEERIERFSQDEYVLQSGFKDEILNMYDDFNEQGFGKRFLDNMLEICFHDKKNVETILKILNKASCDIYTKINALEFLSHPFYLNYKNRIALFEELCNCPRDKKEAVSSRQWVILSLIDYHSDVLENNMLELAKTINNCSNISKIMKLRQVIDYNKNNMFTLEDENLDTNIKTLIYLFNYQSSIEKGKNYEEIFNPFSCVALWDKDEFYNLDFEALKKELINLPEEERGTAITKARVLIKNYNKK